MKDENTLLVLVFAGLTVLVFLFGAAAFPPLAAFFFFYFFYPRRDNPFVKRAFAIAGVLLAIWIWAELKHILAPFLISFFIAYLFDPLIDILERRMKRGIAVALFMAVVLAMAAVLILFIVPAAVGQMAQLVNVIGKNQGKIIKSLSDAWEYIENTGLFDTQKLGAALNDFMKNVSDQLMAVFTGFASVFQSLFNLIIIPVITFYLLKDYDKISLWIFSLFKDEKRSSLERGYGRFNRVFGSYFRGVLLDSLLVGVITALGVFLAGIPYALFIGIITFVFNLIPYVGIWMAFGLSVIFTLAGDGSFSKVLLLAVIYFSVQIVESSFIYPRVVGRSVGMYPIAVMIMLLILSHFMGIFGLFLGVPISALAWYWIQERFGLGAQKDKGGKNG